MQFPLEAARHAQLLIALDELAQSQRTTRKLLVCSYAAEGRELLRALGLARRGWIGFEPTDPRKLANELVAHDIVRDGLRIADAFDLEALLDQAIDDTITRASERLPAEIRALSDQVGFRKAIRRSIEALRLEGIDSAALRCADLEDLRKRNFLADIYASYELKLRHSRLADTAEVYRRAAHGLSRGSLTLPRAAILLVPGLPMHGLRGRFIEALRTRGAQLLNDDACGLEPPRFNLAPAAARSPGAVERTIEIFAASSPLHEIKEVLRRCVAAGLHWDEVEIIASDANSYGCALDSLARRLGIPVSYAVGLPANRTRPGRVVAAYLRWVQEDFSDEVVRALLESGDLLPDGEYRMSNGVSLARTLRKLRIGWGRYRYLDHLEAAERKALTEQVDEEEELAEEKQRRMQLLEDLTALRSLFTPILQATPSIPDRLRRASARIAPAALANGVAQMLKFAVTDHTVDRIARERIEATLERVRATMTREMSFESAMAVLRERLDVRVPAVGAAGPAPWSSSPGHLHFSDIQHGGFTGRRATFIVGLDAGRFPRAAMRDPLLTDHDRLQVAPALMTTAERVAEAQFRFAALFARLRGEVTLSYSAYDTVEGRKLGPSAVLLEAYRAKTGNPAANYEQLRAATQQIASAVARREAVLDSDDVWLSMMSDEGIIHAAQHVVRNAFPGLNRGLIARDERATRSVNAFHGLVSGRDSLDPRITGEVVSPSRLESLGTCALRYFYRYVLQIRPPDIPQFDPDVWLDPRNRGSLLHDVYEQALRDARIRGIEVLSSDFESLAQQQLKHACLKWRGLVPPPSDTVYQREVTELRADVSAFASMCRDDGARWRELELQFGQDGERAVIVPLLGGRIKLQGRIDRVDENENGELVVIDYKTGSAAPYRGVAFDGGRRLQHYLYAIAVEQLLGQKVARMEYRFPTARADNAIVDYDVANLTAGREVISALLDNVAAGRFLPTDDRHDCTFCDFQTCCRVTKTRNETHSPLAAWANNLAPMPDEYRAIHDIRGRFR
ncbi:MAG TPA: PD-(D/E)XK nuclease family protein [Longimicrobiales bacterium]